MLFHRNKANISIVDMPCYFRFRYRWQEQDVLYFIFFYILTDILFLAPVSY